MILGSPAIATANFAWPPLIYAYTYRTWWVVLPGLLIEWLVYFFAWRLSLIRATMLTLAVNVGSAAAGLAYVLLSLAFLVSGVGVLMVGFVWVFALAHLCGNGRRGVSGRDGPVRAAPLVEDAGDRRGGERPECWASAPRCYCPDRAGSPMSRRRLTSQCSRPQARVARLAATYFER